MKIKLSDYVAEKVASFGIRDVFLVTGGGAMHLNDSLGKCKKLRFTAFHQEQAASMAAESYARLSNKIALLNVTTGPGGVNALNGVYGAYTDSVPMLVISGQVRFDTTKIGVGLPNLRQMGDQEIEIIPMVKGITKYSVMLSDPLEIEYHLEKAYQIAVTGRPGPTWVDIPINFQGAIIETDDLKKFDPKEIQNECPQKPERKTLEIILEKIKSAKRPVLFAGGGVRLSGMHSEFIRMIDLLQIPVVTGWNAHDVLHDSHPCYAGRPGSIGDRPGNFAVQNSDVLLILGSRLNVRQVSYNWASFAREAYKIWVDADPEEFKKPTVRPDLPIHSDLKDFIPMMLDLFNGESLPLKKDWMDQTQAWRKKYPVVLSEYRKMDKVNPYIFAEELFSEFPEDQIVVTGDGTACVCTFQAAGIKKGQRLYTNSGSASMGYDLPAAIGACIASGGKKIVCIAGDGSIQMNLQELQTIIHHRFPIKIFVLNNDGYHSIRQTQGNFFGEPYVGCGPESGVSFPDMGKLATAYGYEYRKAEDHASLRKQIQKTLDGSHPAICEIFLTKEQQFAPKLASQKLPDGKIISKPLEDLAPFLDRDELLGNMFIKPMD